MTNFNQKLIVSAVLASLAMVASSTFAISDGDDAFNNGVSVETRYDFNFSFSGPSNKYPLQAFTDGKKTWFQFSDLSRPPVPFANSKPVAYRLDGMYLVVEGVHPTMNFIDAYDGTDVLVNYEGAYSVRSTGTLHSVSTPIAINGVANMPEEITMESAERVYQLRPAEAEVGSVLPQQMVSEPKAEVEYKPRVEKPVIAYAPSFLGGSMIEAARNSIHYVEKSYENTAVAKADVVKPVVMNKQQAEVEISQPATQAKKLDVAVSAYPSFMSPQSQIVVAMADIPSAQNSAPVDVYSRAEVKTAPSVKSGAMTGEFIVSMVEPVVANNAVSSAVEAVNEVKFVKDLSEVNVYKNISFDTSGWNSTVNFTKNVLADLSKYVSSGYQLVVTGRSGLNTEAKRVTRANKRADNAVSGLIKRGIPKDAVHINTLTAYGESGNKAGITVSVIDPNGTSVAPKFN